MDQAAFLEIQRRMAEEEARRGTHPNPQAPVPTGMERVAGALNSPRAQAFLAHPATQGTLGVLDYMEQVNMRPLARLVASMRGDQDTVDAIMAGGRYEPGMLTGNQWIDMGIGGLLSADNLIPGMGLVPLPSGTAARAGARIGDALGLSDWSHVPGLDRARQYTAQTVPPPSRMSTATPTGKVSAAAKAAQQRITRRLAPRITRNPQRLAQLDAAIRAGVAAGGHNWYDTTQMKDLFVRALGNQQEADELFNVVALLTAATSPNTNVGDNIQRAMTLVDMVYAGRGYPEIKALLESNPQYRNVLFDRSLSAAMLNDAPVRQALEEGALNGQKISTFLTNYLDNLQGVTVDTHNLRALLYYGGMDFRTPAGRRQIAQFFDMPAARMDEYANMVPKDFISQVYGRIATNSSPSGAAYGALEDLNRTLAARYNLSPRDFQSALWVGAADITGVDDVTNFDQLFMNIMQKRASDAGIQPEELIRRVVSGNLNLADVLGEDGLEILRRRAVAAAGDVARDEVAPAQPDSFDREQWTPPTGMNDERLGEIARQLNQP
jgi:hypothetical protein